MLRLSPYDLQQDSCENIQRSLVALSRQPKDIFILSNRPAPGLKMATRGGLTRTCYTKIMNLFSSKILVQPFTGHVFFVFFFFFLSFFFFFFSFIVTFLLIIFCIFVSFFLFYFLRFHISFFSRIYFIFLLWYTWKFFHFFIHILFIYGPCF